MVVILEAAMRDNLMKVPSLKGMVGGMPKGRHFQKTFQHYKLTALCFCITIIVLRGHLGVVSFGYSGPKPGTEATSKAALQNSNGHISTAAKRVLSAADEAAMREEESEPAPDPNKPYSLGPEIKNWDEQRAVWLERHPGAGKNTRGKDRVLLVTGSQPKHCDNPSGDHLLLKSLKNKVDYCRLHDIQIFYNMAFLDQEMAGFWAKLPLIRKLMLAHPEIEWVYWMDSDALFTDMVFEIPIEKYRDYNMVLHGFKELIYEKKDWVGLNTGSFLFRNCQWSLDLLDAWAPMGPKGPVRVEAGKLLTATLTGRPDFEADDQSALIYLLVTQDQWKEKVFLETAYYLHGYWVILVERYEEMMANNKPGSGDDRWPFVTHFVGCKPCGSYGDYDVNRCINQMERAFNFADNQVLEHYGFLHRSLGTAKVKRIRNDTADPLGVQAEITGRNHIGGAGGVGVAGVHKFHQGDMDGATGNGSAQRLRG